MSWTTPVIAANWKMHKGPDEARSFFERFLGRWPVRDDRSVLFFPPSISFPAVRETVGERDDVALGVQNVHWEAAGAFTGEISAPMAAAAGADLALVGHSERRHVFGETDDEVTRKVRAARNAGLDVVVCVGETIEERRAGRVEEVILRQLAAALEGLGADDDSSVMVAYEPVWAIGTGETATPDDAAAAHGTLRGRLEEAWSAAAGAVPILYGGSVKPHNAAELLGAPDVDGVLVGSASLDPGDFAAIGEAAPVDSGNGPGDV